MSRTQKRRKAATRGLGLASLATLGILALALATPATAGERYVKWDQPPDPIEPNDLFYGWNEESFYGDLQIAADDWYCDSNDPVSDIHWWGSYIGWPNADPPSVTPTSFHITIWTDVPADPNDPNSFSHPGQVIWVHECYDYTWEFVGWDFNPQDPNAPLEACFLFHCDLPVAEWFYQYPDENIYWLSIAGRYDAARPVYPWGWKTRPRDPTSRAPDAAVRIFDPTAPHLWDWWVDGQPIRWPSNDPIDDWDLAFYLTSKVTPAKKWSQPPVFNPNSPYPQCFWGWDEASDYNGDLGPIILDDWRCSDERPVTDVHWWGSYLDWDDPNYPPQEGLVGFYIGIWSDVPVGYPDPNFSHPGDLMWLTWAPYPDVYETPVGCDYHPVLPWPETCFYYSYNIPTGEWFYQEEPDAIYWLMIAAVYMDPSMVDHPWGWKTRPRDPDSLAPDDAVRMFDPIAPIPGEAWVRGEPIWWPDPNDSWDTAFELTTTGYDEIIKWYQPPEPLPDAYNGWNEYSVYDSWQIVADDWVCENDDPISDVHWWGSYIGWGGQDDPPNMPDAFHFGIWTDVPAGSPPDPNFSHPGDMLWEHVCTDFTWTFDGWDISPFPLDPPPPPEACFYFECDLPEDVWFYQDPDQNIYWISISAIYYDGPPDEYAWGWKTRPRDPYSPAPDDAVMIYDPTAPIPGVSYVSGWPIYWPTPQDSWDMAFQLTATRLGLTAKWTQDPYPPGEGFDAVSNLWWADPMPPGEDNMVVADDFLSDGRDILALQWWGSYYDERYEPNDAPTDPYVLDGWLIGVHWADINVMPWFPPDVLLDGHPTVLAVYFAPAAAVQFTDLNDVDCLGHPIYEYYVSLDECCLLCAHTDPRNNYLEPGCHGAFQELQDYRYWVSIQAVTGVEWLLPDCDPIYTGHLPPADGQFWGWHNGFEPPNPPFPLNVACVGQIVDFTPYPPDCWDYGNWVPQPWLCPSPPEPVNMAFEFLASDCPENLFKDGTRSIGLADLADLLARYGLCRGMAGFSPQADFDNDGCIGLSDLAQLLSVYGLNCPTR